MKPWKLVTSALLLVTVAAAPLVLRRATAQAPEEVPLVTGKVITPTGTQTNVGSFPANMLLTPDGRHLVVTNTGYREFLTVLSTKDGSITSQIAFNEQRKDGSGRKEALYYGLAFGFARNGSLLVYASRGAEDRVSIFSLSPDGKLHDTGRFVNNPSTTAGGKVPNFVAGVALNRDGTLTYAVNNYTGPETGNKGSLSILETATSKIVLNVPVPGFPYAVAAITRGPDLDQKVYVSSERDGVVVAVHPASGQITETIETGDHPVALLLNKRQDLLYVANAGSDTVSVIDTRADEEVRTITLRPEDVRGLPGCTPTGLALSPNEKRLYVTLADMNAVAVVDAEKGTLEGYIPVGWYPTAVAVSPDNRRLFVANAKGVNARNPNQPGQHVNNILEGTVSTLVIPGRNGLRRATAQVIQNNRIVPGEVLGAPGDFKNPGIEHIIYVLKENRTYDQILGDLPTGNGDPKRCMFPRPVTPNHHALAERFVLLDNFYCTAEVSADGWNWSTSGMANTYVTRNAPHGYSGRGRNYDYEGRNNGTIPDLQGLKDVARAPSGYIWDHVIQKGLSLRNYGFFVDVDLDEQGVPKNEELKNPSGNRPTKRSLLERTDENFRQFDMSYPDSDAWVIHNTPAPSQRKAFGKHGARSRFEAWKREFDEFVRKGELPRFTMIRLPRDHTQGTSPGFHSPRAMVADNDYAVGQLVEAVSKSPFWKKTAIFIIEDDAQNGHDHVDAHRSVCFIVSPYVKKATVDHRFYNTDSVLRTMLQLLDIPPMNQYVAVAPLLRVFGEAPENDAPWQALLPDKAIIGEVNGARAYRAKDSKRLDFTKEDAIDDHDFNDILWHAVMGEKTPEPPIRFGLRLSPRRKDDEDDD
jgi:YVTN family beta-propeller protein